MFHGEWLIHFDAYSPQNPRDRVRAQAFVDERDVIGLKGNPAKNHPVAGWLRVEVASGEGDYALLVLPQPAQPFGERVLIEKSLLRKDGAS
jgi:hypothetical protein